jgi:hypothetical protein
LDFDKTFRNAHEWRCAKATVFTGFRRSKSKAFNRRGRRGCAEVAEKSNENQKLFTAKNAKDAKVKNLKVAEKSS